MEYTVNKLAKLAGISTRTLRYYDEVGILKPARINSSGYRIYGREEVDQLQQILFFRALDVSIDRIKDMMTSPSYNRIETLKDHHNKLLIKRNHLDKLIENVEKTIESDERSMVMSDKEKFEGFKQKMIEDNEKKYGKEIREQYGEDALKASNKQFKNMSQEQYAEFEALGEKILIQLEKAFQEGDPTSELAREVADLHKQWLTFAWGSYSKEAHANIGRMYVEDERFTAFYDKKQPGLAAFLCDAISVYT
ncbi:MerR family transcriptional regulator [Natranaerovirga pectinivora]|uniref:MerR family transcriptional regulator n=1 Tax=Natranaerovirga pectinivora TaxID=682400 RepID=A0A4R3MRA5_9FIRM|nr:MerR family transcriptional regulator [Natranaerovirga pectinivora]TCT17043.1 MerR family transcriptional regulator [Natranaerovirga pectinivora]